MDSFGRLDSDNPGIPATLAGAGATSKVARFEASLVQHPAANPKGGAVLRSQCLADAKRHPTQSMRRVDKSKAQEPE